MYSGHENESALHTHGVDFMLSEETKAMFGWEPISQRMIRTRFFGGTINISVVQGFASRIDTEPDVRGYFYYTLQGVLDKLPNRDLVILMADYGAKSWQRRSREEIMGTHEEREINTSEHTK